MFLFFRSVAVVANDFEEDTYVIEISNVVVYGRNNGPTDGPTSSLIQLLYATNKFVRTKKRLK